MAGGRVSDTLQEQQENERVERYEKLRSPGPWRARPSQSEVGGRVVLDARGTRVALAYGGPGTDADAALIASAPELLEACREALDLLDVGVDQAADPAGCMRRLADAIARATGAR